MELNHDPDAEQQDETPLSEYLRTDTFQHHLEAILPDHMGSERFVSVCLRQLGQIPELLKCSLPSVIGGMMEAATLGLEIGTQGECWLIPYKHKGKLKAQLQVGVWGHMALAWRSGLLADVQIDVVMKGDRFSFQKGTDGYLHHEPKQGRDLDDVARIEWVYAVVRTLQGGKIFDAFDANWIERIRARSQAPNSPAWNNFYAEQSMAKGLKKVLKVCPKSREMARAITLDDEADAGAQQAWTVDTSLLLPADVALDPKTAEARTAMRDMGAKPGREPEPETAQRQQAQQPQQAAKRGPEEGPGPEEPRVAGQPEHDGEPTKPGDDLGWS